MSRTAILEAGDKALCTQIEYGLQLLSLLPRPARSEAVMLDLCAGYRRLTALLRRDLQAYREVRHVGRPAGEVYLLAVRARSIHAAWQLLHRHLVALHLRDLQGRCGGSQ